MILSQKQTSLTLRDGSGVEFDFPDSCWISESRGLLTVVHIKNPMGWPCTKECIESLFQIGGGNCIETQAKRIGSLEDTAILIDLRNSRVVVIRGGSSKVKLYHRLEPGRVTLTTHPNSTWRSLTPREDVIGFFAAGSLLGPFEMRWTLETCWKGVRCMPPATAVEIRPASQTEASWEILHDNVASITKEEAAAELRKLIDQAIARAVDDTLSYGHRVAFEVSGGIDSAIAASRGLLALSQRGMKDKAFGVSITYPYYEFRREDRFISDVYAHHEMRRISLDGRKLLPFTGVKRVPAHNIPNLAVVGAAQHAAVVDAAAKHGASLLFNGFGGDTLFGMGPTGQYRLPKAPRRPEWFTRWGWKIVTHHWKQLSDYFGSGEWSSKRQFFSGAYIDDGWADTIIAQPRGIRRRCLFTDPDVIPLAARLWSQRPARAPYKSVLREVFAKDLPQSIRSREHKIAYDGLYVRGYRSALPDLEKLISRSEDVLSEAGIKTPHFLEAVHGIAGGDLSGDRLVSAVLACLVWMEKADDLS